MTEHQIVLEILQDQLAWAIKALAVPCQPALRARPNSKTRRVEQLLLKGGVRKQFIALTQWNINLPRIAREHGYTLHITKVRRQGRMVNFYRVTQ